MKLLRRLLLLLAALTVGSVAYGQVNQSPPPPPSGSVLFPNTPSVALTTTPSAAAGLPGPTFPYNFVTFLNTGSDDAWCQIGGSTVSATTTAPSFVIRQGRAVSQWIGSATFFSCVSATTSTTMTVYQANGPMVGLSSGGGSSGGTGLNQLTGDVTAGPGTGSQTATVVNLASVTNSSLANTGLAHPSLTIGSNTGGQLVALGGSLTSANLTAQVNQFAGSTAGLVPTSTGGTTNFLRADGTFAVPSASGLTLTWGAGLTTSTTGGTGGTCTSGACNPIVSFPIKIYTVTGTLATTDNGQTGEANCASACTLTTPTVSTGWAENLCNKATATATLAAGTGVFYPNSSVALSQGQCVWIYFDGTNWAAYGIGGSGGVTWPTSTDIVISNGTNVPAGLAPINGDCVVGSGGNWTAGACAGTATTITVPTTAVSGCSTSGFYLFNNASALGCQALPVGSAAQQGILQGDGSTLTITSGTIACTIATTSQKGCVEPDGTTITISGGIISSTGGSGATYWSGGGNCTGLATTATTKFCGLNGSQASGGAAAFSLEAPTPFAITYATLQCRVTAASGTAGNTHIWQLFDATTSTAFGQTCTLNNITGPGVLGGSTTVTGVAAGDLITIEDVTNGTMAAASGGFGWTTHS